jgi:hypothetical protein
MMARLRSDFWVSAYIRQREVAGAPAMLRRRGAAEAGTIFVKIDHLNGRVTLYGPASQSMADETGERRFTLILDSDPLAIEDRLTREIRFDPDLWLVEVEDRKGTSGLELTE